MSALERGLSERCHWSGSAGSLKLTADNTLRGRAYCCFGFAGKLGRMMFHGLSVEI
jgi:hypothetical protein